MEEKVKIRIYDLHGVEHRLRVERGSNLRKVMLEKGISPYTKYTERLNCGGRGLCATCGVWIESGAPRPRHWHDKAAKRFGYPRLSCQISVKEDMVVRLVDKKIWGKRKERSRRQQEEDKII
ncbi:MAG TPA: 2Fe-2S iron-sulfur cluster binding domain-containing protein [Saprospiraceae bacterium]|nr:2Fe-2S iron-sulfur cluster binding domain-containing protein [Saprospiraceae bacterium]